MIKIKGCRGLLFIFLLSLSLSVYWNLNPSVVSVEQADNIDQNNISTTITKKFLDKNIKKLPTMDIDEEINDKSIKVFKNKEIIINPKSVTPKESYAIVIGIENYPGSSYDLSYCRDDAVSIRSMLLYDYNFEDGNIITLYDSAATKAGIDNAFTTIRSQITSNDVFVFYYSGHGGSDGGGQFLCPYNSLPSSPSYYYDDDELDTQLNNLNGAEKFVILDSCHSGGFISECQASGRYIMTACATSQYSWETPGLRHGVFTYYFLRSFDYATDSNSDGVRSVEECYTYTASHTASYMAGYGESQNPQRYDGISGQAVPQPSFASVSFTPSGNQLSYSFYMYGQGAITTLNLTYCHVSDNIILKSDDLTLSPPDPTGFGFYSGSVQLGPGEDITGYQIIAIINGRVTINLREGGGDTDGDGLDDIFEIVEGGGIDPKLPDTDFDGLNDYEEFYGVSDPLLNDTDGDGLFDGPEVNDYGSSPIKNDTDNDDMSDYYEVHNNLNPSYNDANKDYDGDGLSNLLECQIGSYANSNDSDADTMYDYFEYLYGLNLLYDDSQLDLDNDGLINSLECLVGSLPNCSDSDSDTMGDLWEYSHGLNLTLNDANSDLDGDGLTNLLEFQLTSLPNSNDTDGDIMTDGWEYNNGLNLLIDDATLDLDSDWLDNLNEFLYGTDPQKVDTDGDLYSDGIEVLWGTDPLNPFYSLNAVYLNFVALAVLFSTGYYVSRTYTTKKKGGRKIEDDFAINKEEETYNALEIKIKQKPVQPAYTYSPRPSSYPSSTPTPSYLSDQARFARDLIENRMPPPKSKYSAEGQKATIAAMAAIKFLQDGKLDAAIKSMTLALQLGVPEPMNSEIKQILLTILKKSNVSSQFRPTTYSRPSTSMTLPKTCVWCGKVNSSDNQYCIKCGRRI